MGGLLHYDGSETSNSDDMDTHSHANGGPVAAIHAANGATRQHHVENDNMDSAALYTQWMRTLPSRLNHAELSMPDLAIFLDRALTLVNSGEQHMENVIMKLASDHGLTRLRQLLNINFSNIPGESLSNYWHHLILVYFQIVSHETVLESELIDNQHRILLIDLYGDHGKRGASVLTAAHRSLAAQTEQDDVAAGTTQEHIEICIAVLYCMLTQSGSKMTSELRTVTEAIMALLDGPYLSHQTDRRVHWIRETLEQYRAAHNEAPTLPAGVQAASRPAGIVASAPPASDSASISQTIVEASRGPAPATFKLREPTGKKQPNITLRKLKAAAAAAPEATLAVSSPLMSNSAAPAQASSNAASDPTGGNLRPTFTRHDNDKSHIHNIQILPTRQEILSDKLPYLPREDPSTWHKSRMPGVVDRHFRLVREDTVGQLRIAVKIELAALRNTNTIPKPASSSTHRMSEVQGARTNVYHGVGLETKRFDSQKGMQFILKIRQPPAASHSRSIQDRDAWWRREQRLGPDSLICVLSATGAAHFLTVHSPLPPKPGSKKGGKESRVKPVHEEFTLGKDREHASVIAELASTNPGEALALLGTLADTGATLVLLEFPGQILQSFAPTLAALQIMARNIDQIPFADALTPDFKNFKPSPPAYTRAPNFRYQLQALLPENERMFNNPLSNEQILKRSVLDDVQQDAVKHALFNELALIQGPPGTGKSFTGVKLIEALLDNKWSANLGPIVCVCFTNHALDQLLEHLMDAGISNVIRMGSRSKSERLAPVNIREVAKKYSPQGEAGVQMGSAGKSIKNIVKTIKRLLGSHPLDEQELRSQLESFFANKDIMNDAHGSVDLQALSDADVIGVTTSGLAGKYKRLRKLKSKVVVVEEAGEVLEAHLLTAMLPSVQHAILIGDHQQLRPKVNNYDLSIDNPCSRITLDVSLFERLVSPRYDLSPGLPYVTLEMQRRMHPSISNLVRSTLYQKLGDAPNVHDYPPVAGMARRLFWLDHRNKEDDTRNNPQSVSQSNKWEVGMVAALVDHLQKQGTYSAGDIAVLTPYSGQLKELQAKLSGTCGIMLSERDIDDGIQATRNSGGSRNAIRLSTVDAFQGEEAKVIIISMVRSNDKKMCGFLGTTNRINVLLSRAMHGMYVIGNSSTTSEITMWQNVVGIFHEHHNFGAAFEIACGRHPNSAKPLLVYEPRDFGRVSSQDGCNADCGERLPCGHFCSEKCHSEAMHNSVKCKQRCDRLVGDCGHLCPKPCNEKCEPNCKAMIPCDLSLPCGHHLTEMQCFQESQKTSDIRCRAGVKQLVPGCGHKTISPCYLPATSPKFHCKEACGAALTCGHLCEKDCSDCSPRDGGGRIMEVNHGRCAEECGRAYSDCNHSCSKACHGEETSCPPCSAPCQSECVHMKCKKLCRDPCPPCTNEKCPSGCPHSTCGMPCAAPCDLVPCSKRCKEKLKCGHQCPSICGENCPAVEFCRRCAKENIKSMIVDPVTAESYEDVEQQCIFLPCGHIFTVGALDRHMDMASHYEMDDYRETSIPVALKCDVQPYSHEKPKGCPTCYGSLHTISRYGHIVRRALLDGKLKKFITSSNQSFLGLAQRLQAYEKSLPSSINNARLLGEVTLGVNAISRDGPYQSTVKATGTRYVGLVTLRTEVGNCLVKLQRDELPFQKVREMVQTAGRGNDPAFDIDHGVLQTSTIVLDVRALTLQTELIIATDLVTLWQSKQGRQQTKLSTNFDKNRKDCDKLLAASIESDDILNQAKAHAFWAKFLALDCATRSGNAEM